MPLASGKLTEGERAARTTPPQTRKRIGRDEPPEASGRRQDADATDDVGAWKGGRVELGTGEQSTSSTTRLLQVEPPSGPKADRQAAKWPALRDKGVDDLNFATRTDSSGHTWFTVRFAGTGKDRHHRSQLWMPSKDEAVWQARVIYLSNCAGRVFDDCEVARSLLDDVRVRWLRVKPPPRDTGLDAALFETAEGAVRRRLDGSLEIAASRVATTPERLSQYVSSMGEDRAHMEDFVAHVARVPADEVGALTWARADEEAEVAWALACEIAGTRFDELREDLREKEATLARELLGADAPPILPYRPEDEGEISWLGHPKHGARAVLAAWRASDLGAANRGALTNTRKSEIRKELLRTGKLHEFVRLKFPSLVPRFDKDAELLRRFVEKVQIDHIVSSGCDFDENLWLEFGKINRFFGENRAMPLKRERLGPFVWERVLAVFNRLVRKEAGVFRL